MTTFFNDVLDELRRALGSPLLVHIVANGVRGDSRVLKSAQATQAAGIPTMLLGITLNAAPEAFEFEGIPVVLAPLGNSYEPYAAAIEADGFAHAAWWAGRHQPISTQRAKGVRRGFARRTTGSESPQLQGDNQLTPLPRWGQLRPSNLEIVEAMVKALDVLKPNAIHVHDTVPLPAAAAYASQARAEGGQVRVLYDSHEHVKSLVASIPTSPYYQSLLDIEAEYIRGMDGVLTVSDQIAQQLKSSYKLKRLPDVVTNAPSMARDPNAPSLRDVIGLDPGVPLIVYSGWVSTERGLGTLVRALTLVPDAHLAIVAGSLSTGLRLTLDLSRTLGVRDRVHVAGYVPPAQVTQYLSSADVGVIPLHEGSHLDLSLPTKYREYLHAGLPLVVSRNKAMATEIRKTGVGLIFKPRNVTGLAQQLTEVLSDSDRFKSAITPELLRTYSWEEEVPVLQRVHLRLVAGAKEAPTDSGGVASALATFSASSGTSNESPLVDPRWAFTSLGIGPANYAGQAFAWAESVHRHTGVKATSFARRGGLGHEPHRRIPKRADWDPEAMGREAGLVLGSYTHLIVDAFRPVLSGLVGNDVGDEIEVIRKRGIHLALLAHGSEIRDPARHMELISQSYYRDAPQEWLTSIHATVRRNQQIAAEFDGPLFVSTPDLLVDLPTATWVPTVVDPKPWRAAPGAFQDSRRLRVLHRPSRSEPPIKGTAYIVPVLELLADEGLIELVEADAPVEHSSMPELIGQADIVIDQIITGSYGVAAVEAMCAGRLVLGYLTPQVRDAIADDIPIVDAAPDQLESVLREIVANPALYASIADSGPAFAERWHGGRATVEALAPFLALEPNV
jgi:glycosyltransferase involved in cell wall biosynthesis